MDSRRNIYVSSFHDVLSHICDTWHTSLSPLFHDLHPPYRQCKRWKGSQRSQGFPNPQGPSTHGSHLYRCLENLEVKGMLNLWKSSFIVFWGKGYEFFQICW